MDENIQENTAAEAEVTETPFETSEVVEEAAAEETPVA